MKYWQIAGGGEGRDYSDDFLKYGMAFVGGTDQTRRMESVAEGDCVLLKEGLRKILAVGQVVKRGGKHSGHARTEMDPHKEWLLHYDGWQLPAYCYIDWIEPAKPFGAEGLTQSAICRVRSSQLQQQADSILKSGIRPRSPAQEPGRVSSLPSDWFTKLSCVNPAAMSQYLTKMKPLASRYHKIWHDISEHDTRTFLVIPFLMTLGLREEHIAIEFPLTLGKRRGRADIACFRAPYEGPKRSGTPCMIVETKAYSIGLGSAGDQAVAYAKSLGCPLAVASNGHSYKVFKRVESDPEAPSELKAAPASQYRLAAYLNLLQPTAHYPLDPSVPGAAEAVRLLREAIVP